MFNIIWITNGLVSIVNKQKMFLPKQENNAKLPYITTQPYDKDLTDLGQNRFQINPLML